MTSPNRKYTWRGPVLKLPPPEVSKDDGPAATIRAGASVVIVDADEEGALVAFPPAPYCWRLPRELWTHVHDETPQPAGGDAGGWDGTTLTADMLLRMLQHPNAVEIVKDLVEKRGPEAKAAFMPLLDPLLSALVPPEQLPMVRMGLKSFGVG